MKRRRRKKESTNERLVREWRQRRHYPLELLFDVIAKRLLNNIHVANLRGKKKHTSTTVALDGPNLVSMTDLFRMRSVACILGQKVKGSGVAFRVVVNQITDKKKGQLAAVKIVAYASGHGKRLGDLNIASVRALLRKLNKDKELVSL